MNIEEVLWTAQTLLRLLQKIPSNPEPHRTGAFLTLVEEFSTYSLEKMRVQFAEVGKIALPEKKEKYRALSLEKALRLTADFSRDPRNTVSSYQTRDPAINRWGGAVLFPLEQKVTIISLSGFPELVDEAFGLNLGTQLKLSSSRHNSRVAEISGACKIYQEIEDAYNSLKTA